MHHESTPEQMLQITRQLRIPGVLDALQNWIYGPSHEVITVSFAAQLQRIDDEEALFLLRSCRVNWTEIDKPKHDNLIQQLLEPLLKNAIHSRDLVINATVTTETGHSFLLPVLIDSGCTDSAIDQDLVQKLNLPTKKLPHARNSFNADGTPNRNGPITQYCTLQIDFNDRVEKQNFVVIDLGSNDMFFGYDWLLAQNPQIDWIEKTITFLPRTLTSTRPLECPALAYQQLKAAFEPKSFNQLPPSRPGFDHAINLKPDAPPMSPNKLYPLSKPQNESLRNFIDENLATGRIRPSSSPYAAPFFFIPKQDGKERPTQDYCWLNSWTIRDKYLLPRIDTIIDGLRGSKVFTKLDIRWGFNNVCIREGDEWKAAFNTEFGLFEPTVMFFTLCNSPSTLQRLVNHLFADFIREGWLKIYMDDHNLHHASITAHRDCLRRFLQRCIEHNLFFRIEKCEFEVSETDFLGVVISENSVCMNPLKTKALHNWPTPSRKKDIQSFLGFANFYRRFI